MQSTRQRRRLSALITIIGIFTFAAGIAPSAIAAGDSVPAVVLAIINGDTISTKDVDAIFAGLHSTMSATEKGSFDYRKLLNKLVNDRLLVQEAIAVGIADEDFFNDFMEEQKQTLVSRRFARDNFRRDVTVSDDSVLAYFNEKYRRVRLRTLSVESLATAESLLVQIRSGAPMDSLARLRSVDIHRYLGGLHSVKYWADIEPELSTQLAKVREGDLLGPFPYRLVYALMKVEMLTPADTAELAQYRDYIRQVLRAIETERAWDRFVADLRASYNLVIDSALIGEIAGNTKSVLDSTFKHGSDRPVASLRGETVIDENLLRVKTARSAMTNATLSVDTLLYRELDRQIERKVLYRAGLDNELDTVEAIRNQLAVSRDSALIEVYLRETIVGQIKFNKQEFEEYYRQHEAEFHETDDLRLRQVMIESEARADSAVALLREGADFDYVADRFRHGVAALAEQTEWASLDAFPPSIREDLDSLRIGQSSRAYPTSDGWVVFKLLDRRAGRLQTLSEVEMKIREVMFQRKFGEKLDEVLAKLKENSQIQYFEQEIDAYFGAGSQSDAPSRE